MLKNHLYYMGVAINQAELALRKNDVPVGCVIVKDNKIISKAYNQIEKYNNSVLHAEMIAINKAIKKLGDKRLNDCDMYITLEPCAMCSGALVLSRIKNLFIGTLDPKTGACGSIFNIVNNEKLNHRINVEAGIRELECKSLIKDFFHDLRRSKKIKDE